MNSLALSFWLGTIGLVLCFTAYYSFAPHPHPLLIPALFGSWLAWWLVCEIVSRMVRKGVAS